MLSATISENQRRVLTVGGQGVTNRSGRARSLQSVILQFSACSAGEPPITGRTR
jgi:hypothetical protein